MKVFTYAIFLSLLALNSGLSSANDEGTPSSPTNEQAQKVAEKEKQKQEKIAGQDAGKDPERKKDLDYAAKNFSFVTGAVVLNQFKTEVIMDGGDPPMPALDANGNQRYRLLSGSSDANVFIEAGARKRWAWMDRESPSASKNKRSEVLFEEILILERKLAEQLRESDRAKTSGTEDRKKAAALEVSATQSELDKQKQTLQKLIDDKKDLQQQLESDEKSMRQAKIERIDAEGKRDAKALKAANDKIADLEKKVGEKEDKLSKLEVADTKVPTGQYYGLRSILKTDGGRFLIPHDYSIRLGYAFNDGTDQKASAIAGASDLYSEVDLGWNLIRWGQPTASSDVPIRGSFSFEAGVSYQTDQESHDVLSRWFVGGSMAVGVPLGMTPKDKPTRIVEAVARFGYVNAERPEFIDSTTNELLTENGFIAFKNEGGLGLDVEFNIPITEKLGYLMLRGKINSGFDPNPWSLTIGWTVPLNSMLGGLVGE